MEFKNGLLAIRRLGSPYHFVIGKIQYYVLEKNLYFILPLYMYVYMYIFVSKHACYTIHVRGQLGVVHSFFQYMGHRDQIHVISLSTSCFAF